MLEPGTGGLGPAAKEKDVRPRNIHSVSKSMFRRNSAHSKTRPNKRFCVEYSDIIKVTFLQRASLIFASLALYLFLVKVKSSVNDKISSY